MNMAYLCNSFPEPSESYIGEEIEALRAHFVDVAAYSVQRPVYPDGSAVYFFPLKFLYSVVATWLLLRHFSRIGDLLWRVLRGPEPLSRRIRAVAHTWLGAYFAVLLKHSHAEHIHVHHGYFGSWIGMVAARLLGIGFSMTLHGSDLLVRADYIDVKLRACKFCFTVSEFNRAYILDRYSSIPADKVLLQHLGIDPGFWKPCARATQDGTFHVVSAGRLHAVKNHAFLIRACRTLKAAGVNVRCTIAGDGPERPALRRLIASLELQEGVSLTGQIPRADLRGLYATADVVVLTSHSEGIPVTLMEAMAMQRTVIAPAITGIPELVAHGKTGFLYEPDSMEDLLIQLQIVFHGGRLMNKLKEAAREHVLQHFNSRINLQRFAKTLLCEIEAGPPEQRPATREQARENPVLQQI